MGSKLWNRGCRLGIRNFFSHLRLPRTNHEENEHFQPSLFAKSTHRRLGIFNHDLDRLGFRDVPRPVGEDVSVELSVDRLQLGGLPAQKQGSARSVVRRRHSRLARGL